MLKKPVTQTIILDSDYNKFWTDNTHNNVIKLCGKFSSFATFYSNDPVTFRKMFVKVLKVVPIDLKSILDNLFKEVIKQSPMPPDSSARG